MFVKSSMLLIWLIPALSSSLQRANRIGALERTPPEAIGIIVVLPAKSGVDLPMSFARFGDTHDKLMSIETFVDSGHCGSIAPNSQPATAGSRTRSSCPTTSWRRATGSRSGTTGPHRMVTARSAAI